MILAFETVTFVLKIQCVLMCTIFLAWSENGRHVNVRYHFQVPSSADKANQPKIGVRTREMTTLPKAVHPSVHSSHLAINLALWANQT